MQNKEGSKKRSEDLGQKGQKMLSQEKRSAFRLLLLGVMLGAWGTVSSSYADPVDEASSEETTAATTLPSQARTLATKKASSSSKEEPLFGFDFSKSEIVDIVRAISDLSKQNFIIPEKLKGQRLTILSPTQITAAEALRVFYAAMASNGITVVRSGKFLKLVESRDAQKETIPTCVDADEACHLDHDQMVTMLLRIKYSDASQISGVLKSLMSKEGDIAIFQPTNSLIISEYSLNLQRLRTMIEALDLPAMNDELQIIPLSYIVASDLSNKLTQIFDIQKPGSPLGDISQIAQAQDPKSLPGASEQAVAHHHAHQGNVSINENVLIYKLVPDDRTNQLVIKASRQSFPAIRQMINQLDVPLSEGDQGKIHVYYLENAKSEELATTLSTLIQGITVAKKITKAAPPPAADAPPAAGPEAAVGGEGSSLFEGEVKVTADKPTNSLLVMSSARDYRAMRKLIQKLDVYRKQVYVETAILEVNVNDSADLGLNWHMPFKGFDLIPGTNASSVDLGFLQNAATSGTSPTLQAFTSTTLLISALNGAAAGLFGPSVNQSIGSQQVQIPSFGVILKFLETSSNANLLSNPHVLTTDNEQAVIEVGEMVPFNSGPFGSGASAASLAGAAGASGAAGTAGALGAAGGLGLLSGLSNSTQRIDVSLKLSITPQINERGKIRLEIDQSVNDITGKDTTLTPTTSKRNIKTVVVVEDQQPIVLGGLIRDKTTDTVSKLPFLGDIPILGYLFKKKNTQVIKSSLVLVLTPYIISSPQDFQRILERKMKEHEDFAAEYYGHRKEYRSYIDYTKKVGPLGRMVSTVRRENERFENGGDGTTDEMMVGPKKVKGIQNINLDGPGRSNDQTSNAADAEKSQTATEQQTPINLQTPAAQVVSSDNTAAAAFNQQPLLDKIDDNLQPEPIEGLSSEEENFQKKAKKSRDLQAQEESLSTIDDNGDDATIGSSKALLEPFAPSPDDVLEKTADEVVPEEPILEEANNAKQWDVPIEVRLDEGALFRFLTHLYQAPTVRLSLREFAIPKNWLEKNKKAPEAVAVLGMGNDDGGV